MTQGDPLAGARRDSAEQMGINNSVGEAAAISHLGKMMMFLAGPGGVLPFVIQGEYNWDGFRGEGAGVISPFTSSL